MSHPTAVFTPLNVLTDACVTIEAIRGFVYVSIEKAGPGADEGCGFTIDADEAERLSVMFAFIASESRSYREVNP